MASTSLQHPLRAAPRYWMPPHMVRDTLVYLKERNLIKYDPTGQLPLKSGGTTKTYFDLRMCREEAWSTPAYLAQVFTQPVRELAARRLVEVPLGISPIMTPLAERTRLPIVTIRDVKKPGRLHGEYIGTINEGDRVVIVDDVITDGASKIDPVLLCKSLGAIVVGVLVLVDRQNGWEEKFIEAGIDDVPVWAGFTLAQAETVLEELRAA